MGMMFYNCSSLSNLSLDTLITNQVLDMKGMFSDCKSLKHLDITSFETDSV